MELEFKFIIYINKHGEGDEKALYNINDKEVVMKGDYYHDKIDEKIEGFLKGLEYASMYCQDDFIIAKKEEWIDESDDMFDKLYFDI